MVECRSSYFNSERANITTRNSEGWRQTFQRAGHQEVISDVITHLLLIKKKTHKLKLIETQGQTGRCIGVDEDFNMLLSRKGRSSR